MPESEQKNRSLLHWADALRRGARAEEVGECAAERATVWTAQGAPGAYREVLPVKEAGAFVDRALHQGRDLGPLSGVPCSIKDLYGVPSTKTYAGTTRPLPPAFEAAGPLVKTLLNQGALITGKTHTVAFAFGGIGANATWGTPDNPRASGRVPGGSSSGAGVSLCEGSAWLAFGTDTAGSVRIPAAWTGNVGLKTTKGLWSTEGIVPLSKTLDTPGVLARSAEDAAFALFALQDESQLSSRMRSLEDRRVWTVGQVPRSMKEQASEGVLETVEQARLRLIDAGLLNSVGAVLGGVEDARSVFNLGGPTAIELSAFLSEQLPDWVEPLDAIVKDRIAAAEDIPAVEYLRRLALMKLAHRKAMASFDESGVDAYLSATVINSPPRMEDIQTLGNYRRENILALRNTGFISMLGLCAVTIPCGFDAVGAPVGLQLIGRAFDEARLLALAYQAEEVLGPSKR